MYKGSCHCQAIQLELSGVSEHEGDVETLSCSDNISMTVNALREELIIDCAPSAIGEVEVTPGLKQYFCNLCATPVFTQDTRGNVALHINFYGHDLLAEHHRQYYIR